MNVSKDAITMQNPATGDIAVPYGMAVWSTGIGTRPFVVDFMKQIGQVYRPFFCSWLCILLSVQLANESFLYIYRLIVVSSLLMNG